MPPIAAASDAQPGKASGAQRSGERGERCKIELFCTGLRIEVKCFENGYRLVAGNAQCAQETVGERLAAVRERSPHDLVEPREVFNLDLPRRFQDGDRGFNVGLGPKVASSDGKGAACSHARSND